MLVVIMLLTAALTLCSCEKAECDLCGKEKFVSNMTVEDFLGSKIYYCDDCRDEFEELFK